MKHSIPSEGIIPGYFIHTNTSAGVWAVNVSVDEDEDKEVFVGQTPGPEGGLGLAMTSGNIAPVPAAAAVPGLVPVCGDPASAPPSPSGRWSPQSPGRGCQDWTLSSRPRDNWQCREMWWRWWQEWAGAARYRAMPTCDRRATWRTSNFSSRSIFWVKLSRWSIKELLIIKIVKIMKV